MCFNNFSKNVSVCLIRFLFLKVAFIACRLCTIVVLRGVLPRITKGPRSIKNDLIPNNPNEINTC